ncbi:MAG TPA: FMN-binding negative transcriptional regulator [Steroidobacteraceae bacterium]|nr:FMN-binding negative transcriptional regulator [Steroidobacteraceae bacterium]
MYVPEHFRETRLEVLQAFLERHPLATLVALTPRGLTANHIPLRSQLAGMGAGVLRGHIARANPLWRELEPGAPVLAVFTGAASYVSPSWYPSKQEHGKVVPTWNYAAVHVNGTIRFIEDAAWLRELVGTLTDLHEAASAQRWRVSDAPADYIEGMLRAIVGFEIAVTGVTGKFKGSQNRPAADRVAVAAALRAAGRSPAELAELVPSE